MGVERMTRDLPSVLVVVALAVLGVILGRRARGARRAAYWAVPVALALFALLQLLEVSSGEYDQALQLLDLIVGGGNETGVLRAAGVIVALALTVACALWPGRSAYGASVAWCVLYLGLRVLRDLDQNHLDVMLFSAYWRELLHVALLLAVLFFSCMGLAALGRCPARREEPEVADSAPAAAVPSGPYVMVEPPAPAPGAVAASDESEPTAEPASRARRSGTRTVGVALLVLLGGFVAVNLLMGLLGFEPLVPLGAGTTSGDPAPVVSAVASDGDGDDARAQPEAPGETASLSDAEREVYEFLRGEGFVVGVLDDPSAPEDDPAVRAMWDGETDCALGYRNDGDAELPEPLYVVWPPTGWVEEGNGSFRSIAVVDTVTFWQITDALYQAGYYEPEDGAPILWTAHDDQPCASFINELWFWLGSVELTESRYTDWDLDRSVFEASADSFDGEGWTGDVHVTYELLLQYLSDWSWLADQPFSVECSECGGSTRGPV
ncbi:hypothetical protein [Thermophilibacter provencensis]|uniref:hypothetical protein n=1 Tax=Thermophilibacter provencensis TaxID=1852386 RepID=UPI0029432CA9|nr:hypothetical protein [Thermophilibacter provencensis]